MDFREGPTRARTGFLSRTLLYTCAMQRHFQRICFRQIPDPGEAFIKVPTLKPAMHFHSNVIHLLFFLRFNTKTASPTEASPSQ